MSIYQNLFAFLLSRGHIDFVEETSKNTNLPNEKIRKVRIEVLKF